MIIFVKSRTRKTTNLPKDTTTNIKTNWALPDQTGSSDDFKIEISKVRAARKIKI